MCVDKLVKSAMDVDRVILELMSTGRSIGHPSLVCLSANVLVLL